MRSLLAAVLALLLLAPLARAASNYAPGSLDHYFTLEWQAVPGAGGPVVEGYVHNRGGLHADRMRLSVEALDASGRVVGRTSTWVLGGVPPGNRSWFRVRAPAGGTSYRVEIQSFDWIGRGGGL